MRNEGALPANDLQRAMNDKVISEAEVKGRSTLRKLCAWFVPIYPHDRAGQFRNLARR